ncbi:hypothetical protein Avbf_08371 [Armadillidium vulgare]|nr:hypothetical protein Avbf_08371 [Armadillidium vulgare]
MNSQYFYIRNVVYQSKGLESGRDFAFFFYVVLGGQCDFAQRDDFFIVLPYNEKSLLSMWSLKSEKVLEQLLNSRCCFASLKE